MRIIDISRPLLSAPLYAGDPAPHLHALTTLEAQDAFHTSALYTCLHTGTHLDCPLHVLPDGTDAAQLPAEHFLGECTVVAFDGVMTGLQAEQLLERLPPRTARILLKGQATLSPSAAFVLADAGLLLVGTETPSVAAVPYELEVHRTLLSANVALLEGLDLSDAQPDTYFLIAPPLRLDRAEASPVRAMLLCRNEIDWSEDTWRK